MNCVLFLRGINLGKNNKVNMITLKTQLLDLGFQNVVSYLNTGNILFETDREVKESERLISELIRTSYPFDIPFVIIKSSNLMEDFEKLPSWWWNENFFRKDAFFYLRDTKREVITKAENQLDRHDNNFFIGETALFMISNSKEEYQSSAHSKILMKSRFNKLVTLRNSNTFDKVIKLLHEK